MTSCLIYIPPKLFKPQWVTCIPVYIWYSYSTPQVHTVQTRYRCDTQNNWFCFIDQQPSQWNHRKPNDTGHQISQLVIHSQILNILSEWFIINWNLLSAWIHITALYTWTYFHNKMTPLNGHVGNEWVYCVWQ